MSEPFVGEIRMFAGNFAPRGWEFCDGQLLTISQNDALFSLFGTVYGGDGRTTFALPDLRGRIPLHAGSGPGLSNRPLGSKGGTERVTLNTYQLPPHNHTVRVVNSASSVGIPTNASLSISTNDNEYAATGTEYMGAINTTETGGNQSHNNLMPTLCVHFIVAIFGVYPPRS
ncbi:MAG: phage tail protein [Chitinophagales bacterium]